MSDPVEPTSSLTKRLVRSLRRAGVGAGRLLRASRGAKGARIPRRLLPIGAVGGALALIAVLYLGYDLAKGTISPCEAIFQQASVSLKTKISFLKSEGELEIGREALTDLSERAQMTALNLKTCCTVLEAGRLDPEQFLQCKGSARAYEARLADIADLVRDAVKAGMTTGAIAADAPAPSGAAPSVQQKIDAEVKAAQETSRAFNRGVVAVAKEQALATLAATPPRNVAIEAQEREPNDDGLTTNEIALGAWITASVGAAKDADTFAFMTPEVNRDWIRIELQNRSTTLEPRLDLLDREKTSLGTAYKTTPGADLTYAFVAEPGTRYLARVSSYYGSSTGVYLLRVVATKAYDRHEPNEDILHARTIPLATPVEAGIMDKGDLDFFTLTAGGKEGMLLAAVKNGSTTLQPELAVYDANKALIGSQRNTTAGGDVSYAFKALPNATYYVRVRDYYGSAAGDYTLTVGEPPPGDG